MNHRVRVKFCGITRHEDAAFAVNIGVDAIGMVFYDASPRSVTIKQAQAICAVLPPFICKVGLFVNAEGDEIRSVIKHVPLDLLQFHGDESDSQCGVFKRPYIKALRVVDGLDLNDEIDNYPHASGILLDTYKEGAWGGTGLAFDWNLVPNSTRKSVILAGGLTPDNIGSAIMKVSPYAVDVSGGIESDKGIKDHEKMTAFMRGVQRVAD